MMWYNWNYPDQMFSDVSLIANWAAVNSARHLNINILLHQHKIDFCKMNRLKFFVILWDDCGHFCLFLTYFDIYILKFSSFVHFTFFF